MRSHFRLLRFIGDRNRSIYGSPNEAAGKTRDALLGANMAVRLPIPTDKWRGVDDSERLNFARFSALFSNRVFLQLQRLIAQAHAEGLLLLTVDKAVAKYDERVRKV